MLIAVDPGEKHTGVAWFTDGRCAGVREMPPDMFIEWLAEQLLQDVVDLLVFEEFRLYPDVNQAYSEMKTPELIGQIRLVHRWFGDGVELVQQPASVKKPTRAIGDARGIEWVALREGAGGHCLDAEIHGYHYLLRH